MAYIDWGNIDSIQYSDDFLKNKNKLIRNIPKGKISSFSEAGVKLKRCIEMEIEDSGFEVSRLVDDIYISNPIPQDSHVTIMVSVLGKHVDSLYEEGYPEGYPDIAELLDRGYNAKHIVYKKMDDGSRIYGLKTRAGLNYFSKAVDDFLGNYGSEYNVIDVRRETNNN